MTIDNLTQLVSMILAISLASERVVTMIKTAIPWLAVEKKTDAQEVDLSEDRGRRIIVQLIAFLSAWITSSFLATEGILHLFGNVPFGTPPKNFPVFILGLLASGGSAFWTNILGYTKAVKDIRIQEKATASLKFNILANTADVAPKGAGGQFESSTDKVNAAETKARAIKAALISQQNSTAAVQINI